jgi:hypothetical protein
MPGVIDHFSNYIWLGSCTSKKAVVPTLSFVLTTDIINLQAHLHLDSTFMPTIKFDYDPNYLDVTCRSMVSSVGYATAQFTAPYTHNQLAKMER